MLKLLQDKYKFNNNIISNSIFRKKLNKLIKNMDISLINNILNSSLNCYKELEYNILVDNGELNNLFNSNEYDNQYYTRVLISQLDNNLNEINVSIISIGKFVILKKERIDYISDDKVCIYLFYLNENNEVKMYKEKCNKVNKPLLVKLKSLKKEIAWI